MGPAPEQQAAKDTAEDFPNYTKMGPFDSRAEVDSRGIYYSPKSRRLQPRPRNQTKSHREYNVVPPTDEVFPYQNTSSPPLRSQRVPQMPGTAHIKITPESSSPVTVRRRSPRKPVIHTINHDSDSDSSVYSRPTIPPPTGIFERKTRDRVKLNRIDKYAQRNLHGQLREVDRPSARFGEPIRSFYGDDKIQSTITINRHFDENGNFRYHTLWVDSLAFLALLRDVGKYELYTLNETTLYGFMEPFVDIFYRLDGLREFLKQVDSGSLNQYPSLNHKVTCAEIILDLVEVDFATTAHEFYLFRSADPPAAISYANLWMIYQPGSLVFAHPEGRSPFALMVDSIKYSKSLYDVEAGGPNSQEPLVLHGWFLDFHKVNGLYDGKFGRRSYSAVIEPFEGEKLISKLRFVPEAFFKDEETRNRLTRSGRGFWQLSGPSYREVPRLDKLGRRTLEHERIMVDPTTYPENVEAKSQNYDDGIENASNVAITHGESGRDYNLGSNVYTRGQPAEGFSRSWFNEYNVIDPSSEPTELMLLLCPPTVRAFSLRDKTWGKQKESCVGKLLSQL